MILRKGREKREVVERAPYLPTHETAEIMFEKPRVSRDSRGQGVATRVRGVGQRSTKG